MFKLHCSIISADEIENESQMCVASQEHQMELDRGLLADEEKYDGAKASFTKGTNEESNQVQVIYQEAGKK